MSRDDTVILNEYPRPKRFRKGRKVSVEVKSEQLVHDFDPEKLGEGPAEAIKNKVRKAIESIAQVAAPSTLAKRRARNSTSTTVFNDTGKLARELFVQHNGDSFETKAPTSRLQGTRGQELLKMLLKVAKISPRDLLSDPKVKAEIKATIGVMISKKRLR